MTEDSTQTRCTDPLDHRECAHHGWSNAVLSSIPLTVRNAARRAAQWACADLKIDMFALRFFEPGPKFTWDGNPNTDWALLFLNSGAFDPGLLGRAHCPKKEPTVWVRTGLSPAGTAVIVLHEARHVWQALTDRLDKYDNEIDAQDYMWKTIRTQRFARKALRVAVRECLSID